MSPNVCVLYVIDDEALARHSIIMEFGRRLLDMEGWHVVVKWIIHLKENSEIISSPIGLCNIYSVYTLYT